MTDERGALLAERFEAQRPRLRAVAYRMLGSLGEAEDAVQEAWLRLDRHAEEVENLGGWLTTVVSRVCLNELRGRARRREEELDTQVPDPVLAPDAVLRSDGGALVELSRVLRGGAAIAASAAGFRSVAPFARLVLVNGAYGVLTVREGRPVSVMAFTVVGGRVARIDVLNDPERLAALALPG
ncbi:sigma factor [Kitasatospora griseola]|uniref:sigma factor n=1 Tax=Kitasatospora griseola TaxID=2064 RepID=UPI003826212F